MLRGGTRARWVRVTLAAVVGTALALSVTSAATAVEPGKGTAWQEEHTGLEVWLPVQGVPAHPTVGLTNIQLTGLTIDGEKILAYRIHTDRKFHAGDEYEPHMKGYVEIGWDQELSKLDPAIVGELQWVLAHGLPLVTPDALARTAGATVGADIDEAELKWLAFAATQVAVWHFSEGAELGKREDHPGNSYLPTDSEWVVISKIYDYLIKNAADEQQVEPALTIEPGIGTGAPGDRVGPYTIGTNSGTATLTADGGSIVDDAGNPVTEGTDGTQFWLTRDTPGTVTVTGTATANSVTSRIFHRDDPDYVDKKQMLVFGAPKGTEVTASAKADFAVAPPTTPPAGGGGGLPVTGGPLTAAIVGGILLLTAGAVSLVVIRRRQIRFTA